MEFFAFINSVHKNIRFTMEVEHNGMLSFPDILVYCKQDGSLSHGVYMYRKPTHTELYLNASCAQNIEFSPESL